jgi:hypothetical protein
VQNSAIEQTSRRTVTNSEASIRLLPCYSHTSFEQCRVLGSSKDLVLSMLVSVNFNLDIRRASRLSIFKSK